MRDPSRRRHLISLCDLDTASVRDIVRLGADRATGSGTRLPLDGAVLGVYFRKSSTRTRTAFSTAALRLGARIVAYGPEDLQLTTGETVADSAAVMSGMLDGLVARTTGPQAELREWAAPAGMAVVNAMTAEEHPTQALADLTTLALRFGTLDGLRVLYVGEGNSTAAGLALALTRFPGCVLHLRTPAGYGLDDELMVRAKELAAESGALVEQRHDMRDLPAVDAVYTTRWQTTGSSKSDPLWREDFEPFRVDGSVMDDCPGAVFLHDLPAHRGEEVTADVLDGPRSVAFEQARNKMFSAMGVLEWCLGD